MDDVEGAAALAIAKKAGVTLMEAKKKLGVNGAAAFKLAWMKLAQKIAVQVWREARGLPVNLEKLYEA